MTYDVSGRRVVVLGGSSGIGYATAEAAVEGGARVVVGSRGDEARAAAVERLGESAEGYELDLTDDDGVDAFFESVGAFDYLVCTPAYIPEGGMDVSVEDLQRAFDVKLFGFLRAVRAARPGLAEDGAVCFVSGTASTDPNPDFFGVGLVNAAVESLVGYLALEFAPVRVSAVSPGVVDTWGMDEETRASIAGRLPTGQVTEPEDVAEAVLTCLTNPAIDGTVLRMDGGGSLV